MVRFHVVLLGDSIFDNAIYVPGEAAVIHQLRDELPEDSRATLLAVDGHVTDDVEQQLLDMPRDTTHLIVSAGGNDALAHADILQQVDSAHELQAKLTQVAADFQVAYARMLSRVLELGLPSAVCTIYDQCPIPDERLRCLVPAALEPFNQTILREAAKQGLPVLELRDICTDEQDYSVVSPIEPSAVGGAKIVRAILQWLLEPSFPQRVPRGIA